MLFSLKCLPMRPKDLIFPFTWMERKPLFQDGVLYVPKYYGQHEGLDIKEFSLTLDSFSTIHIEYCSGNGSWVAEKARNSPATLWIAVEKRFDRVQRIWSKKQNFSLKNLLVVCGEAVVFTKFYLRKEMLDQVFVNFPDPWPKERHAKHRLIQGKFIEELCRVLKPAGEVTLVTDDRLYSEQMLDEMQKSMMWNSVFIDPFYVTTLPGYGSSFFNDLWREQGRDIRYMKFKRCI